MFILIKFPNKQVPKRQTIGRSHGALFSSSMISFFGRPQLLRWRNKKRPKLHHVHMSTIPAEFADCF